MRTEFTELAETRLTFYLNDDNAINIFFAGWIQHPSDQPYEETFAFTIDPGNVGQGYAFDRPFILVNDGDWNTGVHQPAQTNELYLEHEMGHYLLRYVALNTIYHERTNYQTSLYDPLEHFIAWPPGIDETEERQHYRV